MDGAVVGVVEHHSQPVGALVRLLELVYVCSFGCLSWCLPLILVIGGVALLEFAAPFVVGLPSGKVKLGTAAHGLLRASLVGEAERVIAV